MLNNVLKKWLRRLLKRPHKLAVPFNEGGGQAVVFLHGIATNHRSWGYVWPHLKSKSHVLALDLLGFGDSPAPKDATYSAEEHAKAVIYTLKKLRVRGPIILIGHSMGALIAVEIAKQKPRLVKQLILLGMPIYRTDAEKRLLPRQDSMYFRLYNQMITRQALTLKAIARTKRFRRSSNGFGLEEKQWNAFEKSLTNTIINQTTFEDIQKLKVPVRMIAGRLDAFVIRKHLQNISGLLKGSVLTMLNEPHEIGEKYARIVAEEVDAAVENRLVDSGRLRRVRLPGASRKKKTN